MSVFQKLKLFDTQPKHFGLYIVLTETIGGDQFKSEITTLFCVQVPHLLLLALSIHLIALFNND